MVASSRKILTPSLKSDMSHIRQQPLKRLRIKLLKREPATIIKLRQLGYPINQISKALGRSTSIIHRILKFNYQFGLWHRDLRKSPYTNRKINAYWRWKTLQRYMPQWVKWICSNEDKPP